MSLSDWANDGRLVEHRASPTEILDLLGKADRDLRDCASKGLSEDWQLAIAYNAILLCATAALAACGYRAAREAHHYRLIQSLAHTIGSDNEMLIRLDAVRKKRNVANYERGGLVSATEVREIIAAARGLRKNIGDWLRENHPELLT